MSTHRVYSGNSPYEIVLSMLEEARATLRETELEQFQAQEIQIRINELGMTLRSCTKPSKITGRGFKDKI